LSHEELNNVLHRDFPDDLVTHDLTFTTENQVASAFRVVRQLNVLDFGPDSDACVSNWIQNLKRALGVDTYEGEFL
jgi:predicted ATP-dependent Lon-type protease